MRKLVKIRDRYFRNGHVIHFGDCEIYRSKEVYGIRYCNCGLLCDLETLQDDYIKIIYPEFYSELSEIHGGVKRETLEFLYKIFPSITENDNIEDEVWKNIEEVFGKEYTERVYVKK